MYLACAMAKHHYDDGEGAVDVVIMMLHKIPSNSFAKSFFLCLCVGYSFFFFFCVVFAMRPNSFAHIRGTADTVAIMGIEYGWPPSCHLATFCLFFVLASFGLLCKCVCVSIYNTRSFTLSDSLGVYSYPLSFGSQTRLRLQLELKSVQCGRQSGGMEKRG